MTETRTPLSRTEHSQEDTILDNNLQNNPTGAAAAVDDLENEGGNCPIRNNHVPPGSSGFQNSLPQPQDQPSYTYDSGPHQTNNNTTSPIDNKNSFNRTYRRSVFINNGHIGNLTIPKDGVHDNGTPTNRNQDKEDENESWVPNSPSFHRVLCVSC